VLISICPAVMLWRSVVDEVRDQALDQSGVTNCWRPSERGIDGDAEALSLMLSAVEHALGELVEVEGLEPFDAAFAGGEGE
jgi:hypothetical protein